MCKDFFIEKRNLDGDTVLENTDTMENCVHFPEEQESDMQIGRASCRERV